MPERELWTAISIWWLNLSFDILYIKSLRFWNLVFLCKSERKLVLFKNYPLNHCHRILLPAPAWLLASGACCTQHALEHRSRVTAQICTHYTGEFVQLFRILNAHKQHVSIAGKPFSSPRFPTFPPRRRISYPCATNTWYVFMIQCVCEICVCVCVKRVEHLHRANG